MRLSTTKQRHRVTLQVSKPQTWKMKTSGQTTGENGYQKNTKQLFRVELKQGRYPPGGQANHSESTLKQSLKQCNKAADSWTTTAWKHRPAAGGGGGGSGQVHKQLHQHPGGSLSETKQQALPAGQAGLPGPHGRGHGHKHLKDLLLQKIHCSATGSVRIQGLDRTKHVSLGEVWGLCHLVTSILVS